MVGVKSVRLAPAERRKRIIDAIVRVVSEHGVPEATTSRIAEAAGVGPGTLYRYFGSREEMLRAASGLGVRADHASVV